VARIPVPLESCRLIDLPKITDRRGNLTFLEGSRHIPFPIRRVYYLYDVPGGAARGGHAHRRLHQLAIAVSGSFEMLLDNGREQTTVRLDRAHTGLIIVPWVWRELLNFSSGAVCLVLASRPYEEEDYIRNRAEFRALVEAAAAPRRGRKRNGPAPGAAG
jgi:dTDP-4-dehydrorhamnose 3,5-epimerase-like enzyme